MSRDTADLDDVYSAIDNIDTGSIVAAIEDGFGSLLEMLMLLPGIDPVKALEVFEQWKQK